jgi:hypothetical protein
MLDHEKELEEQNLKHLKVLQDEQTQSNKREESLKSQFEFLKTSFHSYKVKHLFISSFFSSIKLFHRSISIKTMRKNYKRKSMKL